MEELQITIADLKSENSSQSIKDSDNQRTSRQIQRTNTNRKHHGEFGRTEPYEICTLKELLREENGQKNCKSASDHPENRKNKLDSNLKWFPLTVKI